MLIYHVICCYPIDIATRTDKRLAFEDNHSKRLFSF